MPLSATDFRDFAQCRRAWFWRRFWQPLKPGKALLTGLFVHAGLEGFYKARQGEPGKDFSPSWVGDAFLRFQGEVESLREELRSRGLEMEELEESRAEAQALLETYFEHEEVRPLLPGGQVLGVEETLTAEFTHPLLPSPLVVQGKVDLLILSKGGLYVVDHKTSSSSEKSLRGMEMDTQLTIYAWLVQKNFSFPLRGLIYNRIFRPPPSPPRILESGILSKSTDQRTTPNLVRKALQELGLPEEPYQGLITSLSERWDRFVLREMTFRTKEHLRRFEEYMARWALEMVKILENPEEHAWPSPATFRCNFCPYYSPCLVLEEGGDPQDILERKYSYLDRSGDIFKKLSEEEV